MIKNPAAQPAPGTTDGLVERISWLIRLRWIAIAGVVGVVFFSDKVIRFSLPSPALYAVVFVLGSYNLIFYFLLRRFKTSDVNKTANIQISLDLFCLSALLHFSGGVENPFIFYFIFHMIIASILLSRRASFLQATLAILLFSSLAFLEYSGRLAHYCLKGFVFSCQRENLFYLGGTAFVFMSTLYIAVYLATSISSRLRKREGSLREANLLLKENDRLKSEYVLRVSHDVKEHLAAIQSCLEPVVIGLLGALNEAQTDMLERVDRRIKKLAFFVKALLEITRLKLSKRIEMDYFSLKKTIQDAVACFEIKAKDKGIVIDAGFSEGLDRMMGAQIYIEETMENIIANSVKYTAEGGKINISAEDKDSQVFIRVKDTGIGIPAEELPLVFGDFYRAGNARGMERDGTGLGLSMAKQVIERHKGKIWIESELGKGSCVNILLPKIQNQTDGGFKC